MKVVHILPGTSVPLARTWPNGQVDFVMEESESESHSVVSDYLQPMDCIVYGILQARVL